MLREKSRFKLSVPLSISDVISYILTLISHSVVFDSFHYRLKLLSQINPEQYPETQLKILSTFVLLTHAAHSRRSVSDVFT